MDGMPFEEIGPMAGTPWSEGDLDLLKKLGILPSTDPKTNPEAMGGPFGGMGGGQMDWGAIQGKSSGSGPGTTAGAGAGTGALPSDNNSSSFSAARGGSSGSFSTGGTQSPHQIDNKPQFFDTGPKTTITGYVPDAYTPKLYINKEDLYPRMPNFIESAYRSQANPWSDATMRYQNANLAQNYIKHMLSRGR